MTQLPQRDLMGLLGNSPDLQEFVAALREQMELERKAVDAQLEKNALEATRQEQEQERLAQEQERIHLDAVRNESYVRQEETLREIRDVFRQLAAAQDQQHQPMLHVLGKIDHQTILILTSVQMMSPLLMQGYGENPQAQKLFALIEDILQRQAAQTASVVHVGNQTQIDDLTAGRDVQIAGKGITKHGN